MADLRDVGTWVPVDVMFDHIYFCWNVSVCACALSQRVDGEWLCSRRWYVGADR